MTSIRTASRAMRTAPAWRPSVRDLVFSDALMPCHFIVEKIDGERITGTIVTLRYGSAIAGSTITAEASTLCPSSWDDLRASEQAEAARRVSDMVKLDDQTIPGRIGRLAVRHGILVAADVPGSIPGRLLVAIERRLGAVASGNLGQRVASLEAA